MTPGSSLPPRKVLIAVRHALGGIRTYLKYVFGGLDPSRYRLCIVAVEGAETGAMAQDLKAFQPEIRLVRSRKLPALGREIFRAASTWKPDLLHSHGFTAAVASVPAAVLCGVPHIVTSHNVFLGDEFSGLAGELKRAALTFCLNRVNVIQVVSEGARENTLRYLPSLNAARLHVVRNGVAVPEPHDAAAGDVWRRANAGAADVIFGFFGRFMPEKGFDVLIEAVARLVRRPLPKTFRVLAVNDGSFIREYRAKIERLGISDRFGFLGFSPNARFLMANVDAVVMPSLREACPLVAMEAMDEGTPLIATTIPSVLELTHESPAALVSPADPEALADALARFLSSPESHRDAAVRFAAEAQRRFDIRKTVDGLERLYNGLLKTQTAASAPNSSRGPVVG